MFKDNSKDTRTAPLASFSQLAQRRCDNVVTTSRLTARSKMRVVATSVSDVVTMSLYEVAKTLPQSCYNVTTTSTNGCVGAF